MYQVSLKIFDCMKVEIILASWWERNRGKGGREGVLAYAVSLKDINYNVMWKRGRESHKERNPQKYGDTEWRKCLCFFNLFSILILFACNIMFADKILGVILYGLFGKWLQILNSSSCLNFWDEAWWFLSLRVFWLLPP